MSIAAKNQRKARQSIKGMTLMEVMMAMMVISMVIWASMQTYMQSAWQAEWSAYSLAAQAAGIQQLEQARAAVWNLGITNGLTNLNVSNWSYNSSIDCWSGQSVLTLDMPVSGTNIPKATNFVTLKTVYLNQNTNNVPFQMLTINTVWSFRWGYGQAKCYTNVIGNFYAADDVNPTTSD
jgi:prepilin-type N-terminal cleavage/methylation domain-containing protein